MPKVMDLEDELKTIGENMIALEVAEEKLLLGRRNTWYGTKYFFTNMFASGSDFGKAEDCWPEAEIWIEEYQQLNQMSEIRNVKE